MKHRRIPYGYQYHNGTIIVHQKESQIISDIFTSYINGASLLTIAENLTSMQIELMPGVVKWDKARLKRMIEDERYIGKDDYPAIIDKQMYESVQNLKYKRNTQKVTDRSADIYQINHMVLCSVCGHPMQRFQDTRKSVPHRWVCSNPQCRQTIAVADHKLLHKISERLNELIMYPEKIQYISSNTKEEPTELHRLNQEINHAMNTAAIDKDSIRKKMLEAVSMRYHAIDSNIYITKRMKAEFEQSNPLSDFSAELCIHTVKWIHLGMGQTPNAAITLINGQTFGKENINGTEPI